MTKKRKILLAIGIVVLLLSVGVTAFVLYADQVLTSMVDSQLRKKAETLSGKTFQYKDLDIRLLRGTIDIDSLCFSAVSLDADVVEDTVHIRVEHIQVSGIRLLHTFRTKRLIAGNVQIQQPKVWVQVTRHEKDRLHTDTAELSDVKMQLTRYISCIGTRHLTVENGEIRFFRKNNRFALSADSLSGRFNDLTYSLTDHSFACNDSVYDLSFRDMQLLTADGLFSTTIKSFDRTSQGALHLQGVHACNTTDKWQLSAKKGHVPATWVDARLEQVFLSPVNWARQIAEKNIAIDSVHLQGKVHLFRDVRNKPKVPYPMPQEGIMKIPVPVYVDKMDGVLQQLKIEVTTADKRCGELNLKQLHLACRHFSNTSGATTSFLTNGRLGETAKLNLRLRLTNNSACSFAADMHIRDANGQALDPFLNPLMGLSMRINMQTLDYSVKGDKKGLNGDFCMVYDNLKVAVDKEKMPVEMLAKHANTVNWFLSMVVPPANPRHKNEAPARYEVNAERDPQKNFTMYMMSSMIEGIKQTILPPNLQRKINKKAGQKH